MTRLAPCAAAAAAALILWHPARELWHGAGDAPASAASIPAPLADPNSRAADTPLAPAPAAVPATPAAVVSPPATVASPPATTTTQSAAAAPNNAPGLVGPKGSPSTGPHASAGATALVIVGRNDTFDAIFRRMALDIADLAAIRRLPGIRQSLDLLTPGDAITVTHADGEIKELTRKVSETQTLDVVRDAQGFAAKMIDNPVQTRVVTAAAIIDSSLFQAAAAAHMSDTVALKLANIFAWDIDFVLDIREGDRFTAVYEQIYQDGKYLRDGEILAAEFVNNGKVYRAVRFATDAGIASYYTPDGIPLRKAFLRAPVEFTRVSSVFNPHRVHPILNLIRGHMGTDYAAPTGTPVHAAGDGRVSFAGQRGGYGNAVVLAHSNSVSTLYGHMSRFARRIRVGTHVQQGEVIGYVGMTGLATGPHLHYEYLVNGVHKDPQRVQLPGAEPLRADALHQFRSSTAQVLADLSLRQPASALAGPIAMPRPGGGLPRPDLPVTGPGLPVTGPGLPVTGATSIN